jgi:acyl-CoA synthetase (AMP-forming)/AMP-acid ligase II
MPRDWPLRPPPAALQDRYRAQGLWVETSLGAFVDAQLRAHRDQALVVWSQTAPWRGTLGEVHERALRLAGALQRRGLGPGEPVAFQLPNSVEAAVVFYALAMLGAVMIPVVHFYGPKELRFILTQSRARAHLSAAQFRGIDYLAALEGFRGQLPDLELLAVAGDPARAGRGAVALDELEREAPLAAIPPLDPARPVVIGYTSGTTSDPKGVIHTSYSLIAETRQLSGMQRVIGRPALIAAPVSHFMGMLGALLMPLLRGQPIHLLDVWEPQRVLQIMLEADLSAGSGSTYFLTSLLDAPGCGPEHLRRMERVGLGGAPVPAAVSDRAERLGISTIRSYGSTEHPSVTGCDHDHPADKRKYTDGCPLPGNELRLVDEDGREVPVGEPGEILSRGPERFWGYTDPALSDAVLDAEGWAASGDIGVLDAEGFLTITDRKKDIIIRGGENVSAAEVEEQLMRLPGVSEVAVVAAPDPRLGERGCAFVRMQPGHSAPDLAALRAHLAAAGLAKPKWPEELREVRDFERTPTGKIKKYVLRAQLREEARGKA